MKRLFSSIKTFYRPGIGFMLILWGAVLYSGISVSYKAYENRQLLNHLNDLKKEKLALDVEYGQLMIEESMLSIPNRIEPEAKTKFGMVIPEQENMIYLSEHE